MFPEGEKQGLYHTADATLWFFHAIDRYVEATGDRDDPPRPAAEGPQDVARFEWRPVDRVSPRG